MRRIGYSALHRPVTMNAELINWIEKTLAATAILGGYFLGDIPARVAVMIVLTNVLWIPFIYWADVAVRRTLNPRVSPISPPYSHAA
jgi:hypothetical protein